MADVKPSLRLKWLFAEMFLSGGRQQDRQRSAGIEHRAAEKIVLDHLTRWARAHYKDDREFLPLNDPYGRIHCPVADAYDSVWENVVEIKQPSYANPEWFDYTSNGIHVARWKHDNMRWLTGTSKRRRFSFRQGLMVYAFTSGRVLVIPTSRIDFHLNRQLCRPEHRHLDSNRTPDHEWISTARSVCDNKTTDCYAVPSCLWTDAGNYEHPDDLGTCLKSRYVPTKLEYLGLDAATR